MRKNRGKSFFACMLAVLMCFGTFCVSDVNAEEVTDNKLNNFLSAFVLETDKGTEIQMSPKPSVNTYDEYLLTMTFEEVANGIQFANECTYELPSGLTLPENLNQPITAGDKQVATATANAGDREITITFMDGFGETPDDNLYWSDTSLECELKLKFCAKFVGMEDKEVTLDLGNAISCVVDLKATGSLSVEKTSGTFDKTKHTIDYTVKVTAVGDVNTVELNEEYSNNMTLVADSVKVDNDTATATDATSDDPSMKKFTLSLGNMTNGETKTVTYSMKADDSVMYADGRKEHTFTNHATATGYSTVVSNTATTTTKHTQNNIDKTGTRSGDNIYWTITLGDKDYRDGVNLGGVTLVDTIGQYHTFKTDTPANWSGPIKVEYYLNSDKSKKNVTYYNDLNNVTLPAGTTCAIIYYYTDCTPIPEIGAKDYTNTATVTVDGHVWTFDKTVTIKGDIAPSVTKTLDDDGKTSKTMKFRIEVDMPAGMNLMPYVYFRDTFVIDEGIKMNSLTGALFKNINITVDGVPYTKYRINSNYIYFGDTLTGKEQSKWEFAESTKLVITYDVNRYYAVIPIDSKHQYTTIDEALKENLYLKNTASIFYKSKDAVSVLEKNSILNYDEFIPEMDKKAVKVDAINRTIDYEVTVQPFLYKTDTNNTEFRFEDTFDERLEYVEKSLKVVCRHINDSNKLETAKYYNPRESASTSGVSTADPTTLFFNSASMKKDGTGDTLAKKFDWDDTLVIRYTLKLKDDVELDKNNITVEFTNEAKILRKDLTEAISKTNVVAFPTGTLLKAGKKKAGTTDVISYTIDVNPTALELHAGKPFKLKDTAKTDNFSLLVDSLKVNKIVGADITPVRDCWTFSRAGKDIEFDLEDKTYYQITYDVKVTEYGEDVKVSNEVKLIGIDKSSVLDEAQFGIEKSSGSASSSHGTFILWKSDRDDGSVLPGATFDLYTKKTTNVDKDKSIEINNVKYYYAKNGTFTTNSDGYVIVDNTVLTLKDGDTYALVETKAPTGYKKMKDPYVFTFNPPTVASSDAVMNEASLSIENESLDAVDVDFSKRSINGDELSGAECRINGTVLGKTTPIDEIIWTSDSTNKTISLKPGRYTLSETKAPTGYELAGDISFTVESDRTVKVNGTVVNMDPVTDHYLIVMVDEYVDRKVNIRKTDVEGKDIIGAQLEIAAQDGTLADRWTTDGTTHVSSLQPGTYTLREVRAPQGYYIAEPITFTVDFDKYDDTVIRIEEVRVGEIVMVDIDHLNDGDDRDGDNQDRDVRKPTKKDSSDAGTDTADHSNLSLPLTVFISAMITGVCILFRKKKEELH